MTDERNSRDQVESNIAHARMRNQRMVEHVGTDPIETVHWMGALQAQDFAAAKWAVALRTPGSTDSTIEAAFNDGRILRTHLLRPTWHFVTAEDIRWMLDLTAPRVNQAAASMYRRLGLDDQMFRRSDEVFQRALEGGRHLTRTEMVEALNRQGMQLSSLDYVHLLMRAELDGVICSGPRNGKQFTYALLHERAPSVRSLDREEALAKLTVRYFTSHGPATLKDYAWWSGLTTRDARYGVDLAAGSLTSQVIGETEYWLGTDRAAGQTVNRSVHLLPNFDEYVVGYTDRSAYWHESHADAEISRSNPLFNHTVVIDGRIRGTWTRKLNRDKVEVALNLFAAVDRDADRELTEDVERYGQFLGLIAERA